MNRNDALAFAKALAYRESAEGMAVTSPAGNIIELRYHSAIRWPWPRTFSYQLEYFAVAEMRDLTAAINPEQDIVVNLFAENLDDNAQQQALERFGLIKAWTAPIMGRNLVMPWPHPTPPNPAIREVTSCEARDRFNSIAGISNPSDSLDEQIHYFYLEQDDQVIAKGQLVYLGEGTAYISDLFTAPAYRQQGHCSAMMAILEQKARSLGATRAVLAPGLEQIELQLYERYGYSCTAERAVLISTGT